MRLYARVYLHHVLVLFVAGAAASVLTTHGWRGELHRRMDRKSAGRARVLVAEHFDAPGERDAFIQHLGGELDGDLTLRDPSGALLTAAGRPLPAMSADERSAVDAGDFFIRHGARVFGVAPVRSRDGQVLAYLQAAPRRPLAVPIWRHFLVVALMLGLVALLAFPLARRISRPIDRLTEAMRRLGAGELQHRIPLPVRRKNDELSRLQANWNDMAARIENLVSDQRQLLANVSHELRSPLARIRVALALLPDNVAPRAAELEGDVAELERLIEAILTTSRLEANGQVRAEPIELDTFFSGLAERAARDSVTAGAPLVYTASCASFTGDAALIERAVWNLVENAAKYGAPPVELRAEERDGALRISVVDHGPGIPAEERSRVVLPFYRADKSRTPSQGGAQGFGLGLTLAERVARAHGGYLELGDAPGGGLVATLVLPLKSRT